MSQSKNIIKNVRSPRHTSGMLEHLPRSVLDLLAVTRPVKLTRVDTVDGPKNVRLSEWLWEQSQAQAQKALNTGFIQGIKTGLLDPTYYGGYTVQDAVYCNNATGYFKTAEDKAHGDVIMEAFMKGRVASFTKYAAIMFKQWFIGNPTGITMGDAALSYSEFEKGVAVNKEPFYLLIAMLPCEKLWGWLADQIQSGISDTNVYSSWITGNLGGSSKIATFIDENADKYKVNCNEALAIYEAGMKGEVGFFTSATAHVQ